MEKQGRVPAENKNFHWPETPHGEMIGWSAPVLKRLSWGLGEGPVSNVLATQAWRPSKSLAARRSPPGTMLYTINPDSLEAETETETPRSLELSDQSC